jgi:hypothetical protein
LVILLLVTPGVYASNPASLGYSDETVIVGSDPDACAGGVLTYNHDGSFENAYAWRYGGVVPPYYGALGEAYDLGGGTVVCGAYWLSTLPDHMLDPPSDCYVWEGGVGSAPGAVLGVVIGVEFPGIPNWPTVRQFDVDLNISVTGPFTVGYWPESPGGHSGYFCGADLNGMGGHPWTCIAPGIGYPSGWQDPSVVWGPTRSMGCGVYFEQTTPVGTQTWGTIKALFGS